jgi:stage II sporulation protein M
MPPSVKRVALVMALLFLAGLAVGPAAAGHLGVLLKQLRDSLPVRQLLGNRPLLALLILSNNMRVLLIMLVSSVTVVGPAIIVFVNGVIAGAALALSSSKLPPEAILLSVLPHGVVEIPAFVYAASISTVFGIALWERVLKKGELGGHAKQLLTGILVSALLIVVAALIEAYVTTSLLLDYLQP